MAYSIIETVGNGGSQYPINFTLGYNSQSEVTCQVNGEVDGLNDPIYRDLTWINEGLVEVAGGPFDSEDTLVFKRTVDKEELVHDYSNGEAIEESNLDESNKQNLMAIHEILDGRLESPLQQDLDMGGNKITNLADGVAATDAVTVGQVDLDTLAASVAAAAASETAAGVSETNAATSETNASTSESNAAASASAAQAAAVGMKYKVVRLATTANHGLSGLADIDGVTPIANDRVFVRVNTAPEENGVYVAAAGAWTRATDMDEWAEVPGSIVISTEGSNNADKAFLLTADEGGTLETTAITSIDWGAVLFDGSVTLAKLANIDATTNGKAIGKLSGNGVPTLVDILDEDDLVSDSDTALATQQSLKAYVDANASPVTEGTYTVTLTATGGGTITLNSASDIASYERIGNTVCVRGRVQVSSVSSPTGTLRISLPLAVANLSELGGTGAATVMVEGAVDASGCGAIPNTVDEIGSWISCYVLSGTAFAGAANKMQANTIVAFSVTYRTSA